MDRKINYAKQNKQTERKISMDRDIKKIIAQMTLEEKAGMCSGLDFWHTKGVERLGIPSIMMTDGPHGLRKQAGDADHLGLNKSVPATCFPPAAAMACSWDRGLLGRVGTALGEECQEEDVAIILGPGANIKRSPLCGRNFEYFSEDPYLASEMAASHINGVQSQGIGTSLKHFAVNNQEQLRMSIDAQLDERTLHEIYLASFEGAVRKAQPWTVMCAYNKVNGEFCSENKYLLTDVLRDRWGFEGFVMSDWGAVNERVDGLEAGLELEMPSSEGEGDKKLVEAVKTGKLSESVLDQAVERILKIIFKTVDNNKKNFSYDKKAHHTLAREVARESMVLLKNDDSILPLKMEGTVAIIGDFAKKPRYQGGGSSHINPSFLDDTFEEIGKLTEGKVELLYAQGYRVDNETGIFAETDFRSNSDEVDAEMIKEAQEIAVKSDVAVVFAGLPDSYESEGFDRVHMGIPEGHRALIEAVAAVQKNVVVVLSNGSPIEMPWLPEVKGLIEGYLGGQAFGGAVADLLFGIANPCGKLAETFPKKLNDNPSYLNFPGEPTKVEYREGIFIGYRYYDTAEREPLFPFGYGLSYTSFEYGDIKLDKSSMTDNEELKVSVKIKNTGRCVGKEIVQLYVRDIESSVIRPNKELKGFEKVELKAGEEKTVTFTLDKRAFAYYNTAKKDWCVESGDFEILIGKSSGSIQLAETVNVKSTSVEVHEFTRNTTIGEIISLPDKLKTVEAEIREMSKAFGGGDDLQQTGAFIRNLPLRALIAFNGGNFKEKDLSEVLEKLNS
jgi:beta-glucosidase